MAKPRNLSLIFGVLVKAASGRSGSAEQKNSSRKVKFTKEASKDDVDLKASSVSPTKSAAGSQRLDVTAPSVATDVSAAELASSFLPIPPEGDSRAGASSTRDSKSKRR